MRLTEGDGRDADSIGNQQVTLPPSEKSDDQSRFSREPDILGVRATPEIVENGRWALSLRRLSRARGSGPGRVGLI
jgi:hypothetical protein